MSCTRKPAEASDSKQKGGESRLLLKKSHHYRPLNTEAVPAVPASDAEAVPPVPASDVEAVPALPAYEETVPPLF